MRRERPIRDPSPPNKSVLYKSKIPLSLESILVVSSVLIYQRSLISQFKYVNENIQEFGPKMLLV